MTIQYTKINIASHTCSTDIGDVYITGTKEEGEAALEAWMAGQKPLQCFGPFDKHNTSFALAKLAITIIGDKFAPMTIGQGLGPVSIVRNQGWYAD